MSFDTPKACLSLRTRHRVATALDGLMRQLEQITAMCQGFVAFDEPSHISRRQCCELPI